MSLREISVGEHYHLYSRGVNQENIFRDDTDRARFVFALLHQQSEKKVRSAINNVASFQKRNLFIPYRNTLSRVISNRTVELVNFVIMGNHFHATVKEVSENGISKYMHRVLLSYSRYFNIKHDRTGHLFESRFNAVHIKSNEQLLHLSAYIHKNPRDFREWRGKEKTYPWGSYPDYLGKNRWGDLLKPEIILEQFSDKNDYKTFVETSAAKDRENTLGVEHLF